MPRNELLGVVGEVFEPGLAGKVADVDRGRRDALSLQLGKHHGEMLLLELSLIGRALP